MSRRHATKTVTLRNLMTHTSGFCYALWDPRINEYQSKVKAAEGVTPLMFEPGDRWQYGTGIDWTGRLVEVASGMNLEDYSQKNLLGPLGMKDTSYILSPEKFDRLVVGYSRQNDGTLKEEPPAANTQREVGGVDVRQSERAIWKRAGCAAFVRMFQAASTCIPAKAIATRSAFC